MMRVRLKADGRIVEILPDGREQALSMRLEAILYLFDRSPRKERRTRDRVRAVQEVSWD